MKIIAQAINNSTGTRSKPMACDLDDLANEMAQSPELLDSPDEYGILIIMDDSKEPGKLEISQAPFMLASTFIKSYRKTG